MKKIKNIFLLFCLVVSGLVGKAQLLNAGDAVVTMSGTLWGNNGTGDSTVMEILRTRNTAAAPIGPSWVMTPGQFNTFSFKHPNWRKRDMGNIFGVTIDNNRNIYATSTGFYGAQVAGISTGSVWRIDGLTGAVTLLKNLHTTQNANCLGNIKFFNGFLYVSNLANGMIHVIDVASPAINFAAFDPGGATDTRIPHGLAIRNVGGNPRLFFSLNNFNQATTAIHSIGIVGSTFVGVEIVEIAAGFAPNANPITDIAISQDQSTMIMAQRTTATWSGTSAHNSHVIEFKINGGIWINQNMNYQIGTYSTGRNCAGGLSFSKAVIGQDAVFRCDTTIWATSDAIYFPTPRCYGMTGFRHQLGSGSNTPLTNSGVNIDFDNDLTSSNDKFQLGDVEVLDTLLNCANCACGTWSNTPIYITFPTLSRIFPCGGSYSFAQGNVTGTLGASYNCQGTCAAQFSWRLINIATNTTVSSGNALPLNLAQFNTLPCAQYRLVITPNCGGTVCPPCEFFINITCNPPVCCDRNTVTTITPGAASYASSSNPLGFGTYSQAFVLNSNIQMSEFRVNVEHFELNSTDPDCIPCINYPKTWGSIIAGSYNGTALTFPSAALPFNNWFRYSNGREMDYKPGYLFSVVNGQLRLSIAMPNASPVDCCRLTANLCLKFTFKDKDCKECTYIYCNPNIQLLPMVNPPNGNVVEVKPEIGTVDF
jgi:hypothetical protein